MARHKPIVYYRVKQKLIQKGINSNFDFKIYEKGTVDTSLKSISICCENIAIGYGRTVLIKRIGDSLYCKTYHCMDEVSVVKFRDKDVLVVGLQNGLIECVAMCSLQRMATLKKHNAAINDIAFCSNFQYMFSCSRDGTIKKWDIWKNVCELTLNFHKDSVKNLLIYKHKKKKYLLSSGYDGYVYFYNIKKQKVSTKLKIEAKEPIEHMCIFNKKYVIFSVKNMVKVYSCRTKRIIKKFFISSKTIFFLSSFKNHILAASLDKNVYFIDPYKRIGEEESVVVGNCRFPNTPVCIDVYKNVIVLGEGRNGWCIQIHDPNVVKMGKENSKDVRSYKLIQENCKCTNKKLDCLISRFKYRDAICLGIQNNQQCLPYLLDFMSKHRTFDVACKVNSNAEMLLFLKWILKAKNINEVLLEMIGSFLYMNKTFGLSDNQIKLHMKQLLHKLEVVHLWIRAYKELGRLIP